MSRRHNASTVFNASNVTDVEEFVARSKRRREVREAVDEAPDEVQQLDVATISGVQKLVYIMNSMRYRANHQRLPEALSSTSSSGRRLSDHDAPREFLVADHMPGLITPSQHRRAEQQKHVKLALLANYSRGIYYPHILAAIAQREGLGEAAVPVTKEQRLASERDLEQDIQSVANGEEPSTHTALAMRRRRELAVAGQPGNEGCQCANCPGNCPDTCGLQSADDWLGVCSYSESIPNGCVNTFGCSSKEVQLYEGVPPIKAAFGGSITFDCKPVAPYTCWVKGCLEIAFSIGIANLPIESIKVEIEVCVGHNPIGCDEYPSYTMGEEIDYLDYLEEQKWVDRDAVCGRGANFLSFSAFACNHALTQMGFGGLNEDENTATLDALDAAGSCSPTLIWHDAFTSNRRKHKTTRESVVDQTDRIYAYGTKRLSGLDSDDPEPLARGVIASYRGETGSISGGRDTFIEDASGLIQFAVASSTGSSCCVNEGLAGGGGNKAAPHLATSPVWRLEDAGFFGVQFYYIVSSHNRYLEDRDGTLVIAYPGISWATGERSRQKWTFESAGNGKYRIKSFFGRYLEDRDNIVQLMDPSQHTIGGWQEWFFLKEVEAGANMPNMGPGTWNMWLPDLAYFQALCRAETEELLKEAGALLMQSGNKLGAGMRSAYPKGKHRSMTLQRGWKASGGVFEVQNLKLEECVYKCESEWIGCFGFSRESPPECITKPAVGGTANVLVGFSSGYLEDRNAVVQWKPSDQQLGTFQLWNFVSVGNGNYYIMSYRDKYLEDRQGTFQFMSDDNTAGEWQEWTIESMSNGKYRIKSFFGRYLEDRDRDNIVQFMDPSQHTVGTWQEWTIISMNPGRSYETEFCPDAQVGSCYWYRDESICNQLREDEATLTELDNSFKIGSMNYAYAITLDAWKKGSGDLNDERFANNGWIGGFIGWYDKTVGGLFPNDGLTPKERYLHLQDAWETLLFEKSKLFYSNGGTLENPNY